MTGMSAAFVVGYFIAPIDQKPVIYVNYLIVYLFALLIGVIFNYKTTVLKREKLAAMSLIGGHIAHELRTPLLGIKSGSLGMKRYLPILFEAYSLARDHGLPVTKIRAAHYDALLPALERIENETNNANTVIDMLLMNVGKQTIDATAFETCSMQDCVEEAMNRYPFSSSGEHDLIEWDREYDFKFYGVKILMVHVLFNLIKNGLHFIAKSNRGKIRMWVAIGDKHNYFYFKDTGRGVPPAIQPRIFERFFSTTIAGTGIGLSFCKLVVESFEGTISCRSEFGSYTEFMISLPKEQS
jgi:two-component system CAI-1 autoinducer sensor kinase/phosphatase CqsS